MHDVFNKLYATFAKLAEDPQEPIDLKPLPDLLRNELGMASQARYFSLEQAEWILKLAVNELRLLLLPSVEAMSLEELERAWRVRGIVLTVLDDPQIQRWIMNLLPPDIPNQRKLYDSLVFLNRELRFAQRCYTEIIKRIRSNPTTLATHGLVEMGEEEMMQFCSDAQLDSQLASKAHEASYEYLRRELLQKTWSIISDRSKRESLIDEALGKRYDELRKMPFYKRISQFENTVIAVRDDLKDWLTGQRRQKRYPKGGIESFDAEVTTSDGKKISKLEILEGKHESLQTQPEEELPNEADPYDKLVAEIREAHGDNVGETAKVYFEIFFQQEGKKVKQQQVAEATGKNRKTISRHIPKIEKFLRERMKKNLF